MDACGRNTCLCTTSLKRTDFLLPSDEFEHSDATAESPLPSGIVSVDRQDEVEDCEVPTGVSSSDSEKHLRGPRKATAGFRMLLTLAGGSSETTNSGTAPPLSSSSVAWAAVSATSEIGASEVGDEESAESSLSPELCRSFVALS